jgi:hypothetical protein
VIGDVIRLFLETVEGVVIGFCCMNFVFVLALLFILLSRLVLSVYELG